MTFLIEAGFTKAVTISQMTKTLKDEHVLAFELDDDVRSRLRQALEHITREVLLEVGWVGFKLQVSHFEVEDLKSTLEALAPRLQVATLSGDDFRMMCITGKRASADKEGRHAGGDLEGTDTAWGLAWALHQHQEVL